MAGDRKQGGDFEWSLTLLGVIFSVPPVIALIQNHFDIHLHWGFAHFVEYYRATVTPLIDIVQWPFRKGMELLNLHWAIPPWVKDLHTLSFVLAGIFVRGWVRQIDANRLQFRELEIDHERRRIELLMREYGRRPATQDALDELSIKEAWNQRRRQVSLIWHPIKQTTLALALGFSGLGLVALLLPLRVLIESVRDAVARTLTDMIRPPPEYTSPPPRMNRGIGLILEDDPTVIGLVRVAGAAALAVAAFYVSNAIAPQLGF